jgi:predicted nuclease of predicted toxin-antitoxin system
VTIWIDAHLSPDLLPVITELTALPAKAMRDLGLQTAKDHTIYEAAKQANAVLMTKDSDFLELSQQLGTPPQVLWITCGNTSNAYLQRILRITLPSALKLLKQGEPVIEISG